MEIMYWIMRNYLVISVLLAVGSIVLVSKNYTRRLTAKDVVTLSVLSSIAVIGRLVFFFIPAFKPSTAVVVMAGAIFGPVPGILVGFMTGFVSNIVYGHGPWSPFQMISWGLVGILSGLLKPKSRVSATILGFMLTIFVYGFIMNTFTFLSNGTELTYRRFVVTIYAGLLYDLVHAFATSIVLWFGWEMVTKRLKRIRNKYGVLVKEECKNV